jgi:hypothetical protein
MMKIFSDSKINRDIETLYKLHGGTLTEINLIGVANPEKKKLSVWNDALFLYSRTRGTVYGGEGTCSPSAWWTQNHQKGVDNLPPGFWRDIWALGNHRGHTAFVQGPRKISTVRDTNRNYQIDPDDERITDAAWWGIDMHTTYRAVKTLEVIGQASAGCQVWKWWEDFERVVAIAKASGQALFSYLLMDLSADNSFLYKGVFNG